MIISFAGIVSGRFSQLNLYPFFCGISVGGVIISPKVKIPEATTSPSITYEILYSVSISTICLNSFQTGEDWYSSLEPIGTYNVASLYIPVSKTLEPSSETTGGVFARRYKSSILFDKLNAPVSILVTL